MHSAPASITLVVDSAYPLANYFATSLLSKPAIDQLVSGVSVVPLSIAIANNKGGVGKTTTATVIAYILLQMLKRLVHPNIQVLLVDTDSQAHATYLTLSGREFGRLNSLYTIMTADPHEVASTIPECIFESSWDPHLHVLAASEFIEDAQNQLIRTPGAVYRLDDALSNVKHRYAAIIFDTRPSFSLATEMAIVASDQVIIPLEPRFLEALGLAKMIANVNQIRDGWRLPSLTVGGILITKMDRRIAGHHKMIKDLQDHPHLGRLLIGQIPVAEAVTYAHHQQVSVFDYDANSPASKAYLQLVMNILQRNRLIGAANVDQ